MKISLLKGFKMKTFIKKLNNSQGSFFIRLLLLTAISSLLIAATYASRKPIIWVLGDSTATNVPSSKSKPPHYLMGWAQMLQTFFHIDSIQVQNKAQPGQSSKSFSNKIWPSFKNKIKEGDYLIIQFGHNDSKKEEYRKQILKPPIKNIYLYILIIPEK
jgi:pectinesterase